MLAAARAKLVSTSAPAMTSTLDTPSLPKWVLSWAVLGSASIAVSTTISLPSAALADSAVRRASLRTFFGRSEAWLRTTGPKALPPPRNCGAASLPWRARPVPFWAYIFLAVAVTSARPLVLCVPCWRRDSCHTTQRCKMSLRTGTANTPSASSISPALPPSMVLTAIFMVLSLSRRPSGFGGICRRRFRRGSRRLASSLAQAGRVRRILGAGALGGVLDDDVAAARAGDGAGDQQQALLVVGGDDLEVLRGHALVAVVAGHLLAGEGAAGILAVTGRAVAAVRDRHAVAGFQAVEVPAHHRAGEAAADGGADDVDELAGHEVARHQLGADLEDGVLGDAEFDQLLLGLDLGLGEVAAVGLAHVLDLGLAVAELDGGVLVLLFRADSDNLQLIHLQNGDGHVLALVIEDAGHADLLGEETATHGPVPSLPCPLGAELDLDVHARGEVELHQRIDRLRGRIDDIEHALVGADLELLARLLVDVRRAVDRELLDAGRQRDRTAHLRARPLGRAHDLAGRRIEHTMIESLQPDSDIGVVHGLCSLGRWQSLLDDLGDDAGTDGAAALADGKAQALVHGDRLDQLDHHARVVPRHHHLGAFRQRHHARHVRRPEVELRTIVREKRRVPATLLLGQDVGLGLEVRVRRDRPRLGQNLAALDILAANAAQQRPDVVARLALVQQLAEHLNARHHRLGRGLKPHDLDLLADLHDPALDAARHNRAAARDREHVLDRHQERLVLVAHRLRNVAVDLFHQLQDRLLALLGVLVLKRHQRRAAHHRNVVARELVALQELAHFQLDQVQQFRVVHHVDLVHVHNQRRHPDLAGQQDVLARLRHRTVGRRHNQDRPVHLRRARDHVLHVVGVARAVDVRVVPVLRLVLDMRRRDRDAALALLRRLVDLVVRRERRSTRLRQNLRDRRRQRRLAVINVPRSEERREG